MANNWIPVKYGLPKEENYYLVYIHQPKEPGEERIFLDEDGNRVDMGFVYCAYFNAKQGGIWQTDSHEFYNGDLRKVDINNDYYISHWMCLPDKPEE